MVVEQWGERVRDAIAGAMISLLFGAFAEAFRPAIDGLDNSSTMSVDLILVIFESYPGILTLVGLLVAIIIAGPVGFVGYLFETIGILIFFSNPSLGLSLIGFGAIIIVTGSLIWKWEYVSLFFGSGSNHYRRW